MRGENQHPGALFAFKKATILNAHRLHAYP
jgi:hypothetical protein